MEQKHKLCFRIYLVVFSFTHHGIGPSLPSLVPGGRPSTAPSSPLSSAPQSSMPLASSWRRLLPLGLSSPPLPRCTLPVLSQHTSTQGVDTDRQWSQEDVQTLVSQSIGKCGPLLPQHKSGLVHEDLLNLHPNCPPQKFAARQWILNLFGFSHIFFWILVNLCVF